MPGALDGISVLEFSEVIAAPFAGMVLSDMGANVIKIEPPWGEQWRLNLQVAPLESRGFIGVNRGKKSLPVDLSKPEGQAIAHALVPGSDIVLINYRPDVPAKLHIDHATLSAINPRIIYCENTAFGREGPDSDRPGYDIIAQAMTGLMATDEKVQEGVPAVYQSTPFVDLASGLAMVGGICAALWARERTGVGQKVDTTLLGTGLALQGLRNTWLESVDRESHSTFIEDLAVMRAAGCSYTEIQDRYNQMLGRKAGIHRYWYRTYQTQDGQIAVGCLSNSLRKRLLDILGIDGTGEVSVGPLSDADVDRARQAVRIMATRTTSEWITDFDDVGVPAGPVRYAEELWADPQALANGLVVEREHPVVGTVRMTGPLIKMSGTPTEAKQASPTLGQDTEEILAALGYAANQIESLRRDMIVR